MPDELDNLPPPPEDKAHEMVRAFEPLAKMGEPKNPEIDKEVEAAAFHALYILEAELGNCDPLYDHLMDLLHPEDDKLDDDEFADDELAISRQTEAEDLVLCKLGELLSEHGSKVFELLRHS